MRKKTNTLYSTQLSTCKLCLDSNICGIKRRQTQQVELLCSQRCAAVVLGMTSTWILLLQLATVGKAHSVAWREREGKTYFLVFLFFVSFVLFCFVLQFVFRIDPLSLAQSCHVLLGRQVNWEGAGGAVWLCPDLPVPTCTDSAPHPCVSGRRKDRLPRQLCSPAGLQHRWRGSCLQKL